MASEHDPNWIMKAFPHHFPWGRGGPSEKRPRPISRANLFRHYLTLSTGVFQGYNYALHVYDILARASLSSRTFVHSTFKASDTRYNNKAQQFKDVGINDLKAAASYFKACSDARRNGSPLPTKPTGGTAAAAQFFRTVGSACKGAEHTSEHAGDARVRSYNMHYRFGKPTWWYVSFAFRTA